MSHFSSPSLLVFFPCFLLIFLLFITTFAFIHPIHPFKAVLLSIILSLLSIYLYFFPSSSLPFFRIHLYLFFIVSSPSILPFTSFPSYFFTIRISPSSVTFLFTLASCHLTSLPVSYLHLLPSCPFIFLFSYLSLLFLFPSFSTSSFYSDNSYSRHILHAPRSCYSFLLLPLFIRIHVFASSVSPLPLSPPPLHPNANLKPNSYPSPLPCTPYNLLLLLVLIPPHTLYLTHIHTHQYFFLFCSSSSSP